MSPMVYLNGRLVEKADARISVFDHGLLFGDGVWEGLRAYSGKVFRLPQHLDRLFASAAAVRLAIPMSAAELARAVQDTLAANGLAEAYLRVIVTRGAGSLDLDPRKTTDPQVIVIADQVSVYPEELREHGLKVVSVTSRDFSAGLPPTVASLSGLGLVLAKAEAIAAGCLEALLVGPLRELSGCTAGSVFVVKGRAVITPPIELGGPDPVSREAIMELAASAGYQVDERRIDRYDVSMAEECFLAGTAIELVPVVECDGLAVGSGVAGPVTRDLRRRFEDLVRGRTPAD
jgi:branched-chain amino acid aminotransferase